MKANMQITPSVEETDHDLVVNVLATLYDTAKYSNTISTSSTTTSEKNHGKSKIESHAVRSPTPSSSSDSSMEDIKTSQRKKRPISQTLTEEEKLEEERKEKRREKDRIRKRIQREKQRKEKQMQLQAKNQTVLTNSSVPEPVVIPSLQSFFSAYLVSPSAEGDSYGILFPLPKPPQMNVDNIRRIPEPNTLPSIVDNRLKLPQFAPFFVSNNRVMS